MVHVKIVPFKLPHFRFSVQDSFSLKCFLLLPAPAFMDCAHGSTQSLYRRTENHQTFFTKYINDLEKFESG